MSDAKLIDQAERDRAITTFDLPVCVEAAAGTGKTTLMVSRVVEIVRLGLAEINEVVAITFTEAAAAELRARIRSALERTHNEASVPLEAVRLRKALRDLDAAHIETIHAFCQSLLKERPIEAGLDPRFEVLDPLGMQVDFDAAWDEWLTRELELDAAPVERVLLLDFDFKWIKKIAFALNRNRDLLPLKNPFAESPDINGYVEAVATAAASLDRLRDFCKADRQTDDRGARQIDYISNFSAHLADASEEDALRMIAMGEKIGVKGNLNNWTSRDSCKEQQEICRALGELQASVRDGLRSFALGTLVRWLSRFPDDYEALRRSAGKLDFDDLLVLTQRMLRDRKEVRRYFKENFKYLLVDEFQDTDPLQVEIVFFLAEKQENSAADWREVDLDGGKLFVVGDPKQSIYRFRRADIVTYNEARDIIEKSNPHIPIRQNFRCTPDIVALTNTIFERRMQGQSGIQADYIPLVELAERDHQLDGARLAVLQSSEPLPTGADSIRRVEAMHIVALVQSIKGNWQVEIPSTAGAEPEVRPARAEDIAILIPARTGLEIFEEVFQDAGLLYSHEGGWSFYNRQEVQDLIAFLSAVDNPTDQRALVSVLRHIYGLSDERLWAYRSDRGSFDYRREASGYSDIENAYSVLRRFHEVRNDRSLAALVEEAVDATRVVELNLLKTTGQQAVANIYKFCELARQFQAQPASTLHRFVRWLRSNRDATVREGDSALTLAGEDNLKLMTFHAAKGLEFPIVIMANLNSRFGRVNQDYVDRRARRVDFKRKRPRTENEFKTPGFDDIKELETEREIAEHVRQLYVATTRARDHLVISSFSEPGESDWLEICGTALEPLPAITFPAAQLKAVETPSARTKRESADAAPLLAAREQWAQSRRERLEMAPSVRIVTPSGGDKEELLSGEPPMPIPAAAAARLGILLHRLFEVTDLKSWDEEGVSSSALALAAADGLSSRANELTTMALATLRSPIVERALKADRFWREVPFSLPIDGMLVEGSIDLLIEEGSDLVLVDLKSDRVSAPATSDHAARYRQQAVLYTLACRRLTDRTPLEFVFWFARPGVAVTLSAADLASDEAGWLAEHQPAAGAVAARLPQD